jgi:flagellar biosynthesis/type III secretory pathway ATPase
MSTIRYGNLRAEVVSDAGVRIQRLSPGPVAARLLAPRPPDAPRRPLMLGRERETADAFAAITAGQPAGFHAACGYGKTTLLRYVTAAAAERGLAASTRERTGIVSGISCRIW